MNERVSYFFFFYVKDGDEVAYYFEPSPSTVKKNVIPSNYEKLIDGVLVFIPHGSKSQYFLKIPESSPYFNLPLLTSKMDNHSKVKIKGLVKQLAEKFVKS